LVVAAVVAEHVTRAGSTRRPGGGDAVLAEFAAELVAAPLDRGALVVDAELAGRGAVVVDLMVAELVALRAGRQARRGGDAVVAALAAELGTAPLDRGALVMDVTTGLRGIRFHRDHRGPRDHPSKETALWSAGIGPRSRSRWSSVRALRRERSLIDAIPPACRNCTGRVSERAASRGPVSAIA
jgi:hypothetical protein